MDLQIKGKDSAATSFKVFEPNPIIIIMIVKSGMSTQPFFMSLHFQFPPVLTDLSVTTTIESLTSGHFLKPNAST